MEFMTSEKKRNLFALLGVLTTFVISRQLYDLAGIVFQADTFLTYWQFIDPKLLREDLWRSVFYLHSQPPLPNLFTGIILQVFPINYAAVFHGVYYLTGLILAGAIYSLGISLRFPNWLAALLAAGFMVSPTTVLFEHFLTYAYPLVAMLTLSGVFLYQFIKTNRTYWGALFFSQVAIITLTWSLFHLLWLLGAVAILYIFWNEQKKVVLVALLPVLVVVGWYTKNLIIASDFTASSWAGMNLSQVTTFCVPEEERKQLVKSGQLSPFALLPPFRNPNVYLKLIPNTPKTGIPILDNPETSLDKRNQHHLVYVEASRHYLRDALHVIYMKPHIYLRCMAQATYIYFHSSSDYEFISGNRIHIDGLDQTWNRLFYGQWQTNETTGERLSQFSPTHISWWILVGFMTATIGSAKFLYNRQEHLAEPENLLALFMLYNILYVTLIGIVMELGENNRFRFTVDPFLMLIFIFTLGRTLPKMGRMFTSQP